MYLHSVYYSREHQEHELIWLPSPTTCSHLSRLLNAITYNLIKTRINGDIHLYTFFSYRGELKNRLASYIQMIYHCHEVKNMSHTREIPVYNLYYYYNNKIRFISPKRNQLVYDLTTCRINSVIYH